MTPTSKAGLPLTGPWPGHVNCPMPRLTQGWDDQDNLLPMTVKACGESLYIVNECTSEPIYLDATGPDDRLLTPGDATYTSWRLECPRGHVILLGPDEDGNGDPDPEHAQIAAAIAWLNLGDRATELRVLAEYHLEPGPPVETGPVLKLDEDHIEGPPPARMVESDEHDRCQATNTAGRRCLLHGAHTHASVDGPHVFGTTP